MLVGREVVRRFAETMLHWRGRLRASEIQEFAGVSERTARRLLSDWRASGLLPRYRPNAQHCLIPADDFDAEACVSDPSVALALLMVVHCMPGNPFSLFAPPGEAHDLAFTAAVPSAPTRAIIAACLDREAVNLIYAAKAGHQEFNFSPSALVRSRGRYHLRGYRANGRDSLGNPLNDRYVDVVPARAIEAWQTPEAAVFVGLENDDDWNEFDEHQFILSSELSEAESHCYEHEYGISDSGRLKVRNRRALMPYLLQELSERRCWRRDGSSVSIWEHEGDARSRDFKTTEESHGANTRHERTIGK